jgi:hypothetical protein
VGPPDDVPTAEWDPSVLPKRNPKAPSFDPPPKRGASTNAGADLEPDDVRALLSSYQHAMGRFGKSGDKAPPDESPRS